LTLLHTDETGNQTGLNYALNSNYTTRSYCFHGGGFGIYHFFDEQQRLVEITYTHLYGVIDREIIFDKQGRILYQVEIDETDAYNWKYSVYDKRGRIREEGFKYNQTPYGIWKYYDRKGKLTKTKDFGDRINP